jgi:hypothetical protein
VEIIITHPPHSLMMGSGKHVGRTMFDMNYIDCHGCLVC